MLCQESIKGEVVCARPNLPASWKATLVFVVLAILTLTLTCCLIVASFWKPKFFEYGKWVGVVACKYCLLHCMIQAKFRWFTAFRVVVSQSVNPQLSCSLSACYLKMGNCYIVHYQRSLLGIEKP